MISLFKKLFSKKTTTHYAALLPSFPIAITHAPESYFKALWTTFLESESIEDLKEHGEKVYLDWGDSNASHLLYFSILDLYILMQPSGNGWTATLVWVDRFLTDGKMDATPKGSVFLFKIPNSIYIPNHRFLDDMELAEYAHVYKWID